MPARCKTACAISGPFHLEKICAAAGVVVAAMLALAMPALADEAYVCEDGRIVSVRFGELERLARTDPCIARHLARRSGAFSAHPAAGDPASPAILATAAANVDVPLPGRKPAISTASRETDDAPRHAATEIIVHHEAPPASEAEMLRPRVEPITFRRPRDRFYSNEELPNGPVDFRHVPIINAAPGTPEIFFHTR